ncbi:MAG: YbhB/YbcL family Raf kinase inhibitor-like protein [Chloroflexi bacterium]|nr:YbhB/YbcL family Raf kinase inhibitor-like protein [Chloroflexota bacterium]
MRHLALLFTVTATAIIAACSGEDIVPVPAPPSDAATITVSSSAPSMSNGKFIRSRYTCDGVNFSPKITWTGVPDETATLALVVEDPDAPDGSFFHWLVYNLPPDVDGFEEGAGNPFASTPKGGSQGTNSFRGLGYSGPCPPASETHRYRFHLYALDSELAVPAIAEPNELLPAIEGTIIGYGLFESQYVRQPLTDKNVVFDLTPVPSPSP